MLKDSDVVMLIGARLNWLLSHGKGKTWGDAPKKFIQIDIEPKEMDSNVEIAAPVVGDIGSCVAALIEAWAAAGPSAGRLDRRGQGQARRERRQDGAAADEQQVADGLSRRARRVAHHRRRRPDAILVNEGANTLDLTRGVIDIYQPRKRPRRRHLGRHGHRHGLGDRRRRRDRQFRSLVEGDSAVRLLRHGGRDDLPLQPAGLRRHLQQ